MLAWSALVRRLAGIHPVVGDTLFTVSLKTALILIATWLIGNGARPVGGYQVNLTLPAA